MEGAQSIIQALNELPPVSDIEVPELTGEEEGLEATGNEVGRIMFETDSYMAYRTSRCRARLRMKWARPPLNYCEVYDMKHATDTAGHQVVSIKIRFINRRGICEEKACMSGSEVRREALLSFALDLAICTVRSIYITYARALSMAVLFTLRMRSLSHSETLRSCAKLSSVALSLRNASFYTCR